MPTPPPATVPDLSVVLPSYNAGAALAATVDGLLAELDGERFELLVVDDGSADGSAATVPDDPRVRVLHHRANRGKGAALRTGMAAALGASVAMIDADGQFLAADLRTLWQRQVDTRLDVIVGQKLAGGQVTRGTGRQAASRAFAAWVRLWLRVPVGETQVGLKVFSGPAVADVLATTVEAGFAFDAELLAALAAGGHVRMAQQPVTVLDAEASTVSLRAALDAGVAVARCGVRQRRLAHTARRKARREAVAAPTP